MAKSSHSLLLLCSTIALLLSISNSQPSLRPKALVLKITKETSTNQYLTTIPFGTPKTPIKLALDLGGASTWFVCESATLTTNSSTRTPVPCRSPQCSRVKASFCEDTTGICSTFPFNPTIPLFAGGSFFTDSVKFQSTNGANPVASVSVQNFLFLCVQSLLIEGMRSEAIGFAGLGRLNTALPDLFSAAFNIPRKFAVCLGSPTGFVIFGNGPYVVSPGIDISKTLVTTPLVRYPARFLDDEYRYYIGVRSVRVNGNTVPVNASLLSFDRQGNGGTRVSTVDPFTTMETSIHDAIIKAFVTEMAARNIARVSAVSPFRACFTAKDIGTTRTGPAVLPIELVLQNEKTVWSIHGSNAMVRVSNNVIYLCR